MIHLCCGCVDYPDAVDWRRMVTDKPRQKDLASIREAVLAAPAYLGMLLCSLRAEYSIADSRLELLAVQD